MRTTRTTLGENFSEGARLTWRALHARGWCVNDLRGRLKARSGEPLAVGVIDRPLYGDREIALRCAVQIETLLDVPVRAWLRRPRRAFKLDSLRRHAPRVRRPTTDRKRRTRSRAARTATSGRA